MNLRTRLYITTIVAHEKSLPQVVGWSLHDKRVDDQGIVDVDEEGHFLLSAQGRKVNTLELGRGTNVGLKLLTLADSLIVDMLLYTINMVNNITVTSLLLSGVTKSNELYSTTTHYIVLYYTMALYITLCIMSHVP